MTLHLTFDGGGSKLAAAVYDDDYNIIAYRTSGGTNARFLGAERVAQNCEEALGGALDAAYTARGVYPTDACGVAVGHTAPLESVIAALAPDCAVTFIGEAYACRLAGAFDNDGCVVIAGTGSGVAWVRGSKVVHRGGYGPELGDEGSGYWIGRCGLRAAIAAVNGWGEETALSDALLRYVGADASGGARERIEALTHGLYSTFYDDTSPIPRHARIAGFTPYVGGACDGGDRVAAAIISRAGTLLARQAAAMYKNYGIPSVKSLVLCGGAWRSTAALERAFRAELASHQPETPVAPALLPPLAAGAVERARRCYRLEADKVKLLTAFMP
jgi:N-acetylglucosamine kinase-like BadF-type ATPase